ncbi:ribonuclease H-like domain-containing protein, partial [Tanacetum coccineum]
MLSIPKQGEYDMWRLRIEQYFQVQDYALWDVIENGNLFNPAAHTTNADGTSTSLIPGLVTTKEKVQKKNDVKAKTIKKTQKTLLKKMYENFNAPSTESLDSIFNRLQKIWYTHVVVWRNKPDLDTMSFDDFKIVEQEKTDKKITINESDTAGYDKSKVGYFNCHKLGHFARECIGSRNQDSRNRNQDSSRRTVNVEETSFKAMVAIDGAGFDWSYMADDEVPTNMTLMAFSDSEIHNDKTCSKTCLKRFETLKTQLDDLRTEFNKSEFNL